MSEELSSEISDAIKSFADATNYLVEGVQGAAGFALDQAPEVIQELLIRDMVFSLMWFFIGIAFLSAAIVAYRTLSGERIEKAKARARDAYERGEPWTRFRPGSDSSTSVEYDNIMSADPGALIVGQVVATTFLAAFGAIIVGSNLAWISILIAPKLYILEYATSLV